MEKKKLFELDYLRALAILLVIFSHIDNFAKSQFIETYDYYFAIIGLTIFFFISGYLLQYNDRIKSKKEISIFLKKKVIRIYPLYCVSILCSLILFGYLSLDSEIVKPFNLNISYINILIHLTGLQGFFPQFHMPGLWFIGIIFLYYISYSIIVYFSKNNQELVMYSILFLFIFFVLKIKYNIISMDFFRYYLVFLIGALSCALTIGNDNKGSFFKKSKLISFISESSYSIYLFHLQILTVVKLCLNSLDLSQSAEGLLLVLLGIPIVIIFSYYIQRLCIRTTKNKKYDTNVNSQIKEISTLGKERTTKRIIISFSLTVSIVLVIFFDLTLSIISKFV
ncbi:acyltransferase family protein [Methanosarcina horonobensis]|nr:acyltransferase family protein [Methanosarcina horonobensis]